MGHQAGSRCPWRYGRPCTALNAAEPGGAASFPRLEPKQISALRVPRTVLRCGSGTDSGAAGAATSG